VADAWLTSRGDGNESNFSPAPITGTIEERGITNIEQGIMNFEG
jgi:hypothetical protein